MKNAPGIIPKFETELKREVAKGLFFPFIKYAYFYGMNTVYHLHFHDGKDYYFGSISAIYTKFSAEELGVAMQTLYQKGMRVGDFYESKRCVIRRGELIRKPKK